ncbi:MAG TPA: dephospho-CoA kinase [Streptosporangiaceae bacterium]|nr:dephospho-CoA kinase [Streptosporangiaceae bacterium]
MLRVGLTGGIGSGKSVVSSRLAALGAVVIDADLIAREVVAPGTAGLAEVVEAFGPDVLRPDGSLDRPKLGDIVFADADLLGRLNAIVHPRVGARMRELEASAGAGSVLVHDVPLIAENGLKEQFDLVIVVDVPPELQLRRLVTDRGMTEGQARARMAAQASRQQRLAIADIVVDNSGTLTELDGEVARLWAELRRRAESQAAGTS